MKGREHQRADSTPPVNVLGYREGAQWVALALEMDLRGYGETFEAALQDLKGLAETQAAFALFKGRPAMARRPAAAVWFRRYARARLAETGRRPQSTQGPECRTGRLALPPAHLTAQRKGFVLESRR